MTTNISAGLVKELRERTGAGMMECKKALTENAGDIDAAAEWLRKQGLAKADKKADRVAAEGRIVAAQADGKAVLVELKGGDAELARGIAMHVAAMNPPHNKAADVPAEFVAKEKEIELAKMSEKDKAKPAEILEKIISGKINKIINEVTLYGQPYVLNTDQTVEQAVKAAGADVVRFERLVVGEGIEKVVEDYAAEVAKAMQV